MKRLQRCLIKFIFILFALKIVDASAVDMSGLDCIIKPYATSELSSPIAGVIKDVYVDRGDFVKAGQVVAKLESGVEQATVKMAKAKADMLTEIKSKRATYNLNERIQKRTDELYAKKMIPSIEQDKAQTAAAVAEMDLMEAKENQKLAKLDLERAIKLLDRRSLKSPINGVVVEVYKSPGEYVEQQPVLKLAQIDPLNVDVILPLAMINKIKKGMQAEVMPEKPVGGSYTAKVTIVDRVVDASSGTFGIRLEMPNPGLKIPAGLRCNIQFQHGLDKQLQPMHDRDKISE